MSTPTPRDLAALASEIAGLMGGWSLPPRTIQGGTAHTSSWAEIEHTSGASLAIYRTGGSKQRGKLRVAGQWPRRPTPGAAHDEFAPEDDRARFAIYVAENKSAAQIARDIARRLEGPYLATYALRAATLRATLEAEAAALAAAERIAAAVNTTPRPARSDSDKRHEVSLFKLFANRRGSGELRVAPLDGEPGVSMELTNITADEAILILAVLRDDLRATAIRALLHPEAP